MLTPSTKPVGSLLEPCLKMHYPHLLVEIGHSQSLNIDQVATCLRCHFFSVSSQSASGITISCLVDLLVERSVIILHPTPMPPPESDLWWPTVDFKHFPGECRHHALEGFVADRDIVMYWTIVLTRWQDCIVSSLLEHVIHIRAWPTVHGERVSLVVYCSPICQSGLEGCFNFPVLDEVFHEFW